MKKLFVSLPTKGKIPEEIINRMNECKEEVEEILKEEVELIDSFIKEDAPKSINNKSLWYLSKSLEKMCDADVVYCDSGYGQYRGCIVEFSAAIRYGIPIVICNDIDYQGTNFRAIYEKGKWTNFIL